MICPGIKVTKFDAVNSFLLIIKLRPNPLTVLTDVPIDLETFKKFEPTLQDTYFNETRITDIPEIKSTDDLLNDYQNYFDDITSKIKDLNDKLKNNLDPDNTPDNYECPIEDLNIDDILDKIKNGDNSFITTQTIDVQKPETFNPDSTIVTFCNENDQLNVVDQLQIPDISVGANYKNTNKDDITCLFNDDKLKNVAGYVQNKVIDPNNSILKDINYQIQPTSFGDIYDNMKTALKEKGLISDELDPNSTTALAPDIDIPNFTDVSFQLGIPLAVLDSKNEIYLQIINKKVQVTNLVTFDKKYLEIDQDIDLSKDIIIAFFTNGYTHILYYIIEETGEKFEQEITVRKNLTIEYIGIDNLYRKHYCGEIYDIQILTFQNAIIQKYLNNNYLFQPPAGALYYYDWHYLRIKYNLVYPLPTLNPPVKMYSSDGRTNYILHTEKTPYHFMETGYLTQFFCWRVFDPTSFSITFWINKLNYKNSLNENDYKVLIFDEKNNFEVSYNDYENKFKINMEGIGIEYFDYLIQDNLWYMISFEYSIYDQKFYLMVISIDQEKIEDIKIFEIPIKDTFGPAKNPNATWKLNLKKFKFNLSAMLARKNGSFYNDFFNCKFGTLALFDSKREPAELILQHEKEKIVINMLKL